MARTLIKAKQNEDSWQAFLKMNPRPTATFELVNWETAKEWLEKNKKTNRGRTKDNLGSLITSMLTKTFQLTGEPIIFGVSGDLLNGQHRLYAMIHTKTSQVLLVVRNIPDDAFPDIDTGRSRKASDVLHIDGIANAPQVAAIVKFIINFERGFYSDASIHRAKLKSGISNKMVLDFTKKHKKSIEESYPMGYNKDNKRIIAGTYLAGLHYIFKKLNHEQADDFCWKICIGDSLSKSNPILLLRQKLQEDMGSRRPMRPMEKIALVCKTWNLYREKKTVSVLKWEAREGFPKPV